MSSQSYRERIGNFVSGAKKEFEDKEKALKDFGYKVDADRMLIYRLDAQWRLQFDLMDESLDIEDRVAVLDAEIEMVHKAWGRGFGNPEWTVRYNAWRNLNEDWFAYSSQRSPNMRRSVLVEQLMEMPLPDKPDNTMKVVRTVKVKTAEALLKRLGEQKFRIVSLASEGADAVQQWDSDFDETQIETLVKIFGEGIMIQRGKKLTNWAWQEADVTGKSIMVFHGIAQGEDKRPRPRDDDLDLDESVKRFHNR